MTGPDLSELESPPLPAGLERLKSVVLRVNGSLELDTVLREIIASARELTGTRCGVITTRSASGGVEDVVFSGFTAEQEARMLRLAEGPAMYAHFQQVRGVGVFEELPGYAQLDSADLLLAATFYGTPLEVRGDTVGHFFISGRMDGRAFSGEDREVLALLGALAATAIANARAHCKEQRARSDLEALVRTSPMGVVVIDARLGEVTLVNGEARRLARGVHLPGRAPEEMWKELTCRRADGREVPLRALLLETDLNAAETLRNEEFELLAPDGRSVSVLLNATPIRSEDGAVASIVATMQDLAPLKAMERLRSEFTGLVSHELRTPLMAIKGVTATVLGAAASLDPAEQLQFFRIIDAQTERMHGLIGDLMDVGRIETGTLSVDARPCKVVDLIEEARNAFVSGGGRHEVRVELSPELPRIMADGQRIVQVLLNLFTNAARHAPAGTPIRVAAVRDGPRVAVSVSDKGIGIAPEALPRLFLKHAGNGHRVGLGLAICRGLIEAHGGRIRAESPGVGQGATITFTVPLADETRPAAAGGSDTAEDDSATGGSRILVIDDDPHTLRYVRDVLTVAGYHPVVTADPGEVPGLVETEAPDLVLLDLMLPGTTGVAFMERLRAWTDAPVVFISAYRQDETIAGALDAGALDYIVKPFSAAELTARIRAALRRKAGPDPLVLGELVIDFEAQQVTVAGRPIELTATEFRLLRELSCRPGRMVTYDALIRRVWGNGSDTDRVRAAVMRLRRKLGDDPESPAYIQNLHGVGYRMPKPEEGPSR